MFLGGIIELIPSFPPSNFGCIADITSQILFPLCYSVNLAVRG